MAVASRPCMRWRETLRTGREERALAAKNRRGLPLLVLRAQAANVGAVELDYEREVRGKMAPWPEAADTDMERVKFCFGYLVF